MPGNGEDNEDSDPPKTPGPRRTPSDESASVANLGNVFAALATHVGEVQVRLQWAAATEHDRISGDLVAFIAQVRDLADDTVAALVGGDWSDDPVPAGEGSPPGEPPTLGELAKAFAALALRSREAALRVDAATAPERQGVLDEYAVEVARVRDLADAFVVAASRTPNGVP